MATRTTKVKNSPNINAFELYRDKFSFLISIVVFSRLLAIIHFFGHF